MDKDKAQDWIDWNMDTLHEEYLHDKGLKDEFDTFCWDRYSDIEQLEGDIAYDTYKDSLVGL